MWGKVAEGFENHTKYTERLRGQNSGNYGVEAGGTHKNHWPLKG
jgi:hypothetical protein